MHEAFQLGGGAQGKQTQNVDVGLAPVTFLCIHDGEMSTHYTVLPYHGDPQVTVDPEFFKPCAIDGEGTADVTCVRSYSSRVA